MQGHCYGGASTFSPPQFGPFSFHCLLLAFNHFKIVLFVDINVHDVKIHGEKLLLNKQKNTVNIAFTFD